MLLSQRISNHESLTTVRYSIRYGNRLHTCRRICAIEIACANRRVQMERNRISLPGVVKLPTPLVPNLEAPKYLERLALRNGDRIFFQKVQSVDSFTSAANYVQVHCGSQSHRMRSTMNELERKLDPRQFVRIHRCTIINIDCLREFRPL